MVYAVRATPANLMPPTLRSFGDAVRTCLESVHSADCSGLRAGLRQELDSYLAAINHEAYRRILPSKASGDAYGGAGAHQQVPLFGRACCDPGARQTRSVGSREAPRTEDAKTYRTDFGLKRLARYLKGTVRLVQRFAPQKFSDVVTVHAENDFAGTRKSTTGLVCYYGNHEVRHLRLEQPSKHGVCILWRSRVLRSGEGSGQQNGYSRAPAWMGHRR